MVFYWSMTAWIRTHQHSLGNQTLLVQYEDMKLEEGELGRVENGGDAVK
jgi:hypothetical protein